MANEDPSGIPEQIRQNRPFFIVLILALLIAVGTFVVILFMDTESTDIERNFSVTPPAPIETLPADEAAGGAAEDAAADMPPPAE